MNWNQFWSYNTIIFSLHSRNQKSVSWDSNRNTYNRGQTCFQLLKPAWFLWNSTQFLTEMKRSGVLAQSYRCIFDLLLLVAYCHLRTHCELRTCVTLCHPHTSRSRACGTTEQCLHLMEKLRNCNVEYGECVSIVLPMSDILKKLKLKIFILTVIPNELSTICRSWYCRTTDRYLP